MRQHSNKKVKKIKNSINNTRTKNVQYGREDINKLESIISSKLGGYKLTGKRQKTRFVLANMLKLLNKQGATGNIKKGRERLKEDWEQNVKDFMVDMVEKNENIFTNMTFIDTLQDHLRNWIENNGRI